jgi:hypothetical protein
MFACIDDGAPGFRDSTNTLSRFRELDQDFLLDTVWLVLLDPLDGERKIHDSSDVGTRHSGRYTS